MFATARPQPVAGVHSQPDARVMARSCHLALVVGLFAILLFAPPAHATQVDRSRWLMGTLWQFSAHTTPEDSTLAGHALDAGLDEVARLERLLSN